MGKQAKIWITALVLVLGFATFVISRWTVSPIPNASNNLPRSVTARIERRYIQSTTEVNGAIVSGSTTTLTLIAPEGVVRAIITAAPVSHGDVVKAGVVVAEASGRPVILLSGSVPAYRDLKVGDKGSDVQQLQTALGDVGLHPDRDGEVGSLTLTALAALYQRLGYPMPVGGVVRAAEFMFAARLPGRLASPTAVVGSGILDQTVVVDSGEAQVQLKIPPAVVPPNKGDSVELSCSGTTINGVIAGAPVLNATVAEPPSGDAGQAGAQTVLMVNTSKPISNELLEAQCVGTVVHRLTEKKVLAAPSSAIFSTSDGGSDIQVVGAKGTALTVPVTLGASADGWIELTAPPPAAVEGADVIVGSSS